MNEDYRYEIKFVLNEMNYSLFKKWLHIESDCMKKYPDRVINSLYFDDVNFSSVKDNLSGVPDRIKLRLRWYGYEEGETSEPILESKSKRGRLGSKEYCNIPMPTGSVHRLSVSEINKIIVDHDAFHKELASDYYHSTLFVTYKREYFEDNKNLRITVDDGIKYSIPIPSKKLPELENIYYGKRVLELKFNIDNKNYVSEIIRELNVVPSRHSKYLTGLAMFGQVNYL